MLLKRNSELYYYENGFSGEKQIFQEYLCDLKEQHHLADITVLVDYGSNGIEVLESTIFNAEGFMELRRNVVRMMSSLKGFSEASRASLISFYGQDVILRNGVKDMGVEYLSFPNGLYSCLVVTEGWHVQKKQIISGKSLNLLKSFIYQRQLVDFHSVGYSYNGYLGIPTRDELIKRLEIKADATDSSILVGLRVANMESLAQKNYQSTNVMSDIINYMLKYYNGNLFALGEDRIAILATGSDVLECIDTFEAHLLRMGELFPEVSYNINIVPVCDDALTVIYEVEYYNEPIN